jgi:AraC-like DNA-binding protein
MHNAADLAVDTFPVGLHHGADQVVRTALHGEHAVYIADYYKEPIQDSKREEIQAEKYAKSGLNPQLLETYKRALNDLMILEHTYLNSDLTLPKLANLMHCSLNHLSQVINAGFGMSFFDYLNHHRIEAAKNLLSQHDSSRGAILSVAFEVGFNSNSAFYAAFKKTCGQTPAQYRRSQQIER